MTLPHGSTLKIGDCEVDPAVDEISRQGNAIKVEPRAIRVLVYLAERAGQVISVEELLDNVWADLVVTPDSVYTTIAALRRALGDDGKESRYIVNVPRRGYRLVASVTPVSEPEAASAASTNPVIPAPTTELAQSSTRRSLSWLRLTAIIGIPLIVLGYVLVEKPWTANDESTTAALSTPLTDKSIAVLPFVDKSEQKDQEYFADGMTEELVALLVQLPQLTVVGRMSALQFKGSTEDLPAIGMKLGAAHVVAGTVRKEGNRVRVTAELFDTRSGVRRWAESYDSTFGDVLAVQDQITISIARALQVTVAATEGTSQRHLLSADGYNLYLRGLYAYERQTPDMLSEAQGYFEQALVLDPTFLRAAEALALTHVAQACAQTVTPRGAWQQAEQAAKVVLRINPKSSTGHAVMGMVHGAYGYDWDAADAELSQALALDSRDPVAWDFAARVAHVRGHTDEALRRIGASLSLDPLNPYALMTLGQIFFAKGDLAGAEKAFRKVAAVSPAFDGNHQYLAEILLARGNREAALQEAQAEVSVDAKDAALAMVYYSLGRKTESDAALAHMVPYSKDLWPTGIAHVHAYRGERDEAFKWFDKAYELRDLEAMMMIRANFLVASLRGDPRYKALLAKMNLVE